MTRRLFLILYLAVAAAQTKVDVGSIDRSVLESRLRSAPRRNDARQAAVLELFRENGCPADHLEERGIGRGKSSNVICTIAGETDAVIVVGAHFDHVDIGGGVIDNWSGASLLPALMASLRTQPRKHTFLYAAFAAEEAGLVGSQYFADRMSKADRAKIRAMINIDSIGAGPTAIAEARADNKLLRGAIQTSKALGFPLNLVNVSNADSDSSSFHRHKIPVIDFHSLTQGTLRLLHSPGDVFAAIKINDYADTFRLISVFLGVTDQVLD